MAHKISFVKKFAIILKATSDDENATPGYLYKEINDISFESAGCSESLVEFLVDRLQNQSCNVKYKVLKLLKHLVEHGSKEFQLMIRRNSHVIKECTKFGGPPHHLHGNVPYLMVRRLAMELCEMLYNHDQHSNIAVPEASLTVQSSTSKYGGMGPSSMGGSAQGFGNTIQSKTLGETILDGIERLSARISETPADRQAELLERLDLKSSTVNYRPPLVIANSNESAKAVSLATKVPSSKLVSVKKPELGRAGGGWEDEEEIDKGDGPVSRLLTMESDSLLDQTDRTSFDDVQENWIEESELVVNAIKEGYTGTCQVFLPASAISDFVNKCCTLNCDQILTNLVQKLYSSDAGVVIRALQLLEGIIYSRDELVTIDRMNSVSQEALIKCLQGNVIHSKPSVDILERSTDLMKDTHEQFWPEVKIKSAKVLLILLQLSSNAGSLPASHLLPLLDSKLFSELGQHT